MKLAYSYVDLLNTVRNDPSCVEEQTSSAAEGGNQPRTYEIICNLPQAGQYPLRPDDRVLSCRAIDM